jgi:hypothetical protein
MVYSYATRDVVVSKRASAQWFQRAFPEWSSTIEAARRFYDRQMTAQDQELLKSTVRDFFAFACERIRETEFNAFVADWTMDDYAGLKRDLAESGFHFAKQVDAEHLRVLVPLERVSEFAALCQPHLNAPYNYIDIQYPQEKKTVLIFRQQLFIVSSQAENERVKAWAIALGLSPQQAEWGTSFK